MKNVRETTEEYRERLRRFEAAKARYESFDTGIWRLVPDAVQQKHEALQEMWEHANAPARDEQRRSN